MADWTILIDFDGVLRHWPGDEIERAAVEHGLTSSALFEVAFSPSLLQPAITGGMTHEQWNTQVEQALTRRHGAVVAARLVESWRHARFEIDEVFLSALQKLKPRASLVLVTNATSRLPRDLERAGITSCFDFVVNSSSIGVAKPDDDFYSKALEISGASPPRTLFIDDHLTNVEAARRHGIHSLLHRSADETFAWIKQSCDGSSSAASRA